MLGRAEADALFADRSGRWSRIARMLSRVVSPMAYRMRTPPVPARWPFTPRDFERMDETADANFYGMPRFVTHIDDRAIDAWTRYLDEVLPRPSTADPPRLLDLCSSWISMLPSSFTKATAHVTGVGMNEAELKANPVLSAYRTQDLNVEPKLRDEPDGSLDAVVCAVSIDYLTKPREILGEVARALKPGASCHLAFSNRCFPTKVIGRWLRISEDARCDMVAIFLAYAGGQDTPTTLFEEIEAVTVLERSSAGDPLYVVRARRRA